MRALSGFWWRLVAVAAVVVALGAHSAVAAAPANDNFANAAHVVLGMSLQGTNVDATKEPGEPGPPGGHSVWYVWTAPQSGTFAASADILCDPRTLLGVYTGSAVGALTPVATKVGPAPRGGCGVKRSFVAAQGITYHFSIDGPSGLTGGTDFELARAHPPPNDDFADAQLLTGRRASTVPSTVDATTEVGEPRHARPEVALASVWYRWTAPSAGVVRVDLCHGLRALEGIGAIAVYTGTSLKTLRTVARLNLRAGFGPCQLDFVAGAGTEYHLAYATDDIGVGRPVLRLRVIKRAANDDFAHAAKLHGQVTSAGPIATDAATLQRGEPKIANSRGGHSIWFSWTAPRSGKVEIDTCGSSFDTLLAVYTGRHLTALHAIRSNDQAQFGNCPARDPVSLSAVLFAAVRGTTYRIALDGARGAVGDARLHLEMADARPLHCGSLLVHSVTLHADLKRCPGDGLVVASDGVSVNLHGFAITTDTITTVALEIGSSAINDAAGFHRLSVSGGRLTGFSLGIRFRGRHLLVSRARIATSDESYPGVFVTGGSDVVIRSSTILGTVQLTNVRRVWLTADTVHGGGLAPPLVGLVRCSDVELSHNTLTDFNHVAVELGNSKGVTVAENRITGGNVDAVLLVGADRNLVAHNHVTGGGASITLESSDHNRIIDNALEGAGGILIGYYDSPRSRFAGPSQQNLISGNTVTRGLGIVILAQFAAHNTLLDNTAAHNKAGVFLIIIGANLRTPGDGFRIGSRSTVLDNNNAFDNSGHGIVAVAGVVAHHNVAYGNAQPPQCVNIRCSQH